MKPWLKVVLPLGVLALGILGAVAMIKARPVPEPRQVETPAPLVREQEITLEPVQLFVESQGTVSPRTESVLIPEVAGRVTAVAPSFASGGFFEPGETLLRIDPSDYREAVVRARAVVARSELRLYQEQAEAELAQSEWEDLGGGEATPLNLRQPQLAEARAGLDAARAGLDRAERDLGRTEISAPYAGRIRSKQVDVGQYVTPGTPLATVYAVDFAEIRLPLAGADLAYVDLPLDYRGESADDDGPRVTLRANLAGREFTWEGRIVRVEGEIDSQSRMVHVVARVADPYGRGDDPGRPPLATGLFVDADIHGRTVDAAAVVPRSALRGGDRVLVIDADDRLRFREVQVVRRTRQEAVIGSGLAAGERICLTPLVAVTEGMRVRTSDEAR